ncbi:hypothetical protein [Brevibacillus fulvus]|uniref:YgiT-type zinc finger domain-containing protein n=1 Tax=Brevibacillus fulvus TaxID=1125967 RepID=A0A938Y371_9BACL|nr:hypothetical protein [Brevibacillus fulvus]MBM7590787.1 hypothetical protein [Brevibacillus fulvus]
MQKKCSRCGNEMSMMLRNVVYRNRVKIHNVPVHVCIDEHCAHCQVVDFVKDDLKNLMNDLGQNPSRQTIDFEQVSELSNLLVMVANQEEDEETSMREALQLRINELLDMFLLAQSLGDQNWMNELRQKLTQLI